MSVKPSQSTWTLLLKNNRTTILLHIDPLQSLSSLKSELLKALHQTNPSGTFNGNPIPKDLEDIVLAKPNDINDLSAGWQRLVPDNDILETKGKGNAVASKSKSTDKNSLKECPQGVGLRDGGVVAFKFQTAADRRREEEEAEAADDLDELATKEDKVERWDVVVPDMEETYGESVVPDGELQAAGDGR